MTSRLAGSATRTSGTLSVRGDEAEEAWRVVEPVLAAWHEHRVPLEEYPAGSDGPPPIVS
jgi:glucose-6-phosphate 1-dehydrogenase